MPVTYANDNFGNWRSDFPSLIPECAGKECGREVVELLQPHEGDYTTLKLRALGVLRYAARIPA